MTTMKPKVDALESALRTLVDAAITIEKAGLKGDAREKRALESAEELTVKEHDGVSRRR
jgi:hypothetical protein